MKNNNRAPRGAWSQPSPRAEMAAEVKALDPTARVQRLGIGFGKPNHIDDEVIVTLLLEAWGAGQPPELDTYSSELLRRVTKHVRAHVRKNPGWQMLGGGADALVDDLCEEIVLAILEDQTVPCHAEVAFGNYVYRRCLDFAAKLFAKKHSAGQSFDEQAIGGDGDEQEGESDGLSALSQSPEQILLEFEGFLAEQKTLEAIRFIVQTELPEHLQFAFTYRYFAGMKIKSKKAEEVTITRLMGISENTAKKYIDQAIDIIKQRLNHD